MVLTKKHKLWLKKVKKVRANERIYFCNNCKILLKKTDCHHFLCNKCWNDLNGVWSVHQYKK